MEGTRRGTQDAALAVPRSPGPTRPTRTSTQPLPLPLLSLSLLPLLFLPLLLSSRAAGPAPSPIMRTATAVGRAGDAGAWSAMEGTRRGTQDAALAVPRSPGPTRPTRTSTQPTPLLLPLLSLLLLLLPGLSLLLLLLPGLPL